MNYECAKTENCFADSRTWEYRLDTDGGTFMKLLSGWSLRCNRKLRRPVFIADRNGVNIKGVLSGNSIRVSFPSKNWEAEKNSFESWLSGIDVQSIC